MARILLLKMYGDTTVVVNTRNIAVITENKDRHCRTIWTTDGEVTDVVSPFDDIAYAWRHGKDAGEVKVFDDGTV